MKIKKKYSFSNKRHLWRLMPSETGNIVIEERDPLKKEVFYNCIRLDNGKTIFKNFQLPEKYWVGIEAVYGDLILFHKFVKPELPAHLGIIAFDIITQEVIWETTEYNFYFINDNKIYTYRNSFNGKEYYTLDMYTGNLIESLGDDSISVNELKLSSVSESYYKDFLFPQTFTADSNESFGSILQGYKTSKIIAGKIDYLIYRELLLFNFHEVQKNGTLKNVFTAVDIISKKVIFEETLNAASNTMMPDSFFIVQEHLLLLKEKVALIVCSFKE